MKSIFVASVATLLCAVIMVPDFSLANQTNNANANTNSNNGPEDSSSLSPVAQDAICNDTSLANLCPAKGTVDDSCKNVAAKNNCTDPKCDDVGVCSFHTGHGSSSNATTTIVLTKKNETTGYTLVKNCKDGLNIYSKA